MPFRLAPGTWRRFTLKRDAMLAGTSHDPYTSSYHELSAAKVQSIFDTCKFWSSKCIKNLFSLLRRDKIRALAQVFRVKKWYLLFDPSWWRMIFIVLRLKLLLGLSGANFLCPLRHIPTFSPYFVAISFPCRNNFDKNLANFLESAQNSRTFASVIWFSYVICSFCISCFRLLVSNVAYGVRWEASPFAVIYSAKKGKILCGFRI